MSQELIPHNQQQAPAVFQARQLGANVNQGAVAIEQERAVAEAQGQLVLAKKFPRDLTAAHAELMTACKNKAFASVAFYTVPNRGHGPSIRFAEEVARVYGNFQYGHRELSRSEGRSEVEVYAWDMEKNNRSTRQITVMHITDTKNGPKKLTDQADIDNKIANVASKQMRGRILALLAKWLVADAIEECKKTLAGTNEEPLEVRVRRMTQAFAKFGVTTEHLERYLGHKLDEVLLDELVDMTGIYNALKDGAKPSEYFGAAEQAEAIEKSAATITAAAKAGATKQPATKQTASVEEPTPKAAAEKKSNSEQKNSKPVKEEAAPTQAEIVPPEQEKATDPQPGVDDGQDADPQKEEDVF